jgi:hypothetical protein
MEENLRPGVDIAMLEIGAKGTSRLSRCAATSLAIVASLLPFVIASATGAATATATFPASSIEGVWSFNGGQIAIHPGPSGTLVGTVVAETKFAECGHPVGEQIWTGMRLQQDGSYWGFHQWFYEASTCPPNPTLGPTAWRILAGTNGSKYLRVCLSSPGTSQPTISPSGVAAGATYGCVNSALTGALPSSGVLSFKQLVSLPSAKKCFSRRAFQIHVRDPKHDPFKKIAITIGKRKLAVTHQSQFSVATVSLKGLPRGTFTVKILATTVLGHRLSGHRTYHTCVRKRSSSKKHHTSSS